MNGSFGIMLALCDTVLWLESQTTSRHFPVALFSADTDMATDGWLSLTSIDQPFIVITRATQDEHFRVPQSTDGYLRAERRINTALGRTDLRCNWLVGIENTTEAAGTISFKAFRHVYQPPTLLFRDIHAQASFAGEISRTTCSEFERNGGKIIVFQ